MGEFDDVLAMEPGDEWDDIDLDLVPPELPPTRAVLRLPGALVELRGEVPVEMLDRLGPLSDGRLISDEPAATSLVVERGPDGTWALDGPGGHRAVAGARVGDLEIAVLEQLDAIAIGADAGRVHLAVSCVELDGVGIVVASDQADQRAEVTAELLRRGASLVTERVLTVLPGSHTVFGYPAPGPAAVAQSGAVHTAPFTTVDVVVSVRRAPSTAQPLLTVLSAAESCIRLIGTAIDRERFGPAVLDVLASTATNATHRELLHDDPRGAAAAIAAVEPPPRRAFCVLHRFDEQRRDRPTFDGDVASLRVARFDDSALALDAESGRSLQLHDAEMDALEELLVERDRRPSSAGGADPRLARLASHGMYVPDAQGRRAVPGPEAFGLPNCPSGHTARDMWSDLACGSDGTVSGRLVGEVDATAALALLRGLVPGDAEHRREAIEVHRRVQDEVVGVERQLLRTIEVLAGVGVEPLVLGSVVNAHDGPLPPYFAESEQVDLLVRDGELAPAVAALEAAGHHRVGLAVAGDGETHGVVDLAPPAGGSAKVRIRDTLAVGPFGALVDHDEFHQRSVPIRIHGRWCRSLHPEHRFVHACVQVEFDGAASSTQLVRDVVLAAPRADALMAEALEASERWGATATVTAAVRRVDGILPGLPPWIVERSFRDEVGGGRDRRGARVRRGRRSDRRG